MIRSILKLSAIAVFLATALPLRASHVAYENCLAAADIERVCGLTNLARKVTGPELNVRFQGAKAYKLNRETADYVKGEVAGVGEEAFYGPAVGPPYVPIFRNKDWCVRLYTYIDKRDPSKTVLTMDQLIALGKTIASRK